MTRTEAIDTLVALHSGVKTGDYGIAGCMYRFDTLQAANQCKAILDALLPAGSTGEVAGAGLLMVCTSTDPTDHQGDTCPIHEEAT